MKYIKSILILYLLISNGSCAIVYEQDVQQGNAITDEMLNNLQIGMSQAEVQYFLGTPLVEDPFHANRWDYFYAYREGGNKQRQQQIITLMFDKNSTLEDIRGNATLTAANAEQVKMPNEGNLNSIVNKDENSPGLWKRMKTSVLGQ